MNKIHKIKLFKRNQQRNLDISGMKHDKNIKKTKTKDLTTVLDSNLVI